MPLLTTGAGAYIVAAGGDSAAATNFLARTSGLDTTHTNAYKTLLNGLTTDGFFDGSGNSTKLDGLWFFATQDQTTANLNLVKSGASYGPCTVSGTMTWTANSGYVKGAGADWLDTNLNLSTLGGNASQNSLHFSVWNGSASPGDGNCQVAVNAASGSHIYCDFSGAGNAFFRIGDTGAGGLATASGNGFFLGNRSASNAWQGYRNGSSLGSGTDASSALANGTVTYPAGSSSGQTPSTDLIMAGSAGANLSSTDAANLYARVHVFLQTVAGVP